MTTFKSALSICGLSQSQAADLFDVKIDTVKSWCAGRNAPPPGVWDMLADLYRRIEDAADHASAKIEIGDVHPRQWGHIQSDDGADPFPGAGADVAGAMALLIAIREIRDDEK